MAATCAWLGDSQAKQNCESKLAAASARPGAPLQKVWGIRGSLRLAVACLIGFREMLEHEQRPAIYMEKSLLTAWVGVSWVGQSLRSTPELGKQCKPGWWILRYDTHLLTLWLCGQGSKKAQQPLLAFLFGRKLFPNSHLDARHFSSSLHAPGVFQAQYWSS